MDSVIANSRDVLVLIVMFGLAIFVHEFGHFLAARWCGMVVEVFSIGFGPAIWKKKVNGITYKIGCIPVGGYVALPQLDPSGMATIQGEEKDGNPGDKTPADKADEALADIPPIAPWKKIVVSIAGPIGNIILAVILAWVIYGWVTYVAPHGDQIEKGSTLVGYVETNSVAYAQGLRAGDSIAAVNGKPVSSWIDYMTECHLTAGANAALITVRSDAGERTLVLAAEEVKGSSLSAVPGVERSTLCVLSAIMPDSPAEKAGLQAGDIVKTFDGQPVASREHFIALVAASADRAVRLALDRMGTPAEATVTPRVNEDLGRAVIGAQVSAGMKIGMQWMEHTNPWDQLRGDARSITRILKALTSRREARQAAKALGGPLMIFATLWISIQTSLLNAVGFIRFLCVNLAILNLLPLPVLDGGHVMFSLWEIVTGRKPHPRVVNVLVNGFACLLIAALIFLTLRDSTTTPGILRNFGKLRAAERAAKSAHDASATNAVAPEATATNETDTTPAPAEP